MNYNYGYFPQTYNPYPQQPNNNGLTWVQGEAAAKSWYVPAGTTTALWDSEAQVIYLKSADASGMPSMKVLDYTIRGAEMPQERVLDSKAEYVTRDDLNALYDQINDLRDDIDNLSIRRTAKKKEVVEE